MEEEGAFLPYFKCMCMQWGACYSCYLNLSPPLMLTHLLPTSARLSNPFTSRSYQSKSYHWTLLPKTRVFLQGPCWNACRAQDGSQRHKGMAGTEAKARFRAGSHNPGQAQGRLTNPVLSDLQIIPRDSRKVLAFKSLWVKQNKSLGLKIKSFHGYQLASSADRVTFKSFSVESSALHGLTCFDPVPVIWNCLQSLCSQSITPPSGSSR